MHHARPQTTHPVARQQRPATAPLGAAPVGNERIKDMLKHFGLRTSLIRLKVIDTLLQAEREAHSIGMRGVHGRLASQDVPLSFLSVREVLKRLCQEGLVSMNDDKTYCLEAAVREYLQRP
ncbi:fe2+ zn2+ uptake regulation protein [Pseudomonas typographi]|uniref:Fe2+ zn2+ uptake regulation protein n=1 Tax=Pseudomonas typographi TaxID=2715964 RepID=A0ABR7Z646_9PSED|nr:fe2+ zn2+ uptake regulation protein [Pseudomonas typographi]MBD1554322.1 fe2+ zn2+ uptake regulation protein [Pseudomonas typographi]MBD1589550.1 fe2+ zn2+ uptake regulation protein [Pseudomonas typographi]MBD1600930.1 fe2+ zn2+ uptake regulation protein [Pseudomonas typographi]